MTKKEVKRAYYPFDHENALEIKDNKCVLIMKYDLPAEIYNKIPFIHDSHLCGYVAFPINEVPDGLRINAPDSYLNFINVPGGISYCQAVVSNKEFQQIAMDSYKRRLDNIDDTMTDLGGFDIAQVEQRMDERIKARIQYEKDLIDLGAHTVVYGFDTGHAGDDDIEDYQSVKLIMQCCEQMEDQLKQLFSRYEELEAAEPEDRASIMDEIRATNTKINTRISPLTYFFESGKFKKKRK